MSSPPNYVSPPRKNVLFVPHRNVLLTKSRWGGERTRSSHHDPAGQRPTGGFEEGTEKADRARSGGTRTGITARQVRRLLVRLRKEGDRAIIHKLRGRQSSRRLDVKTREKAVGILSREVYRGFGPTLASEYLANKHGLRIGREALRRLMIDAGLWRVRRQKVEAVHQWRQRRSCRGELVQWDTSGTPVAGRPRRKAVSDPHDRRRHQRNRRWRAL